MSTDNLPALRFGVPEIAEMAKNVARSKLFGMDEAQTFTLMLLAQSKGLHPIQAVERYHVIQNRPAMKADAMLAEFQAHGGVIEWHQHDHLKCEATFTCPSVKTPTTVSWSIEDAKKAELTRNAMYTKYPRQMLRSRVISEGIRMMMPGILSGIYTPEEVADFEPVQARASLHEEPAPTGPTLASTKDARRFSEALNAYCERVNAAWLDRHQAEDGSIPPWVKELVTMPQITNHMLKEAGVIFPDGGKFNDRVRAAAALWLANEGRTVAEWKYYVATLAAEAKAKLAPPEPEDESQEVPATEDAEPVLAGVTPPWEGREPGSDDGDYEEGVDC